MPRTSHVVTCSHPHFQRLPSWDKLQADPGTFRGLAFVRRASGVPPAVGFPFFLEAPSDLSASKTCSSPEGLGDATSGARGLTRSEQHRGAANIS